MIAISSPVAGWVTPLDEVPDPVDAIGADRAVLLEHALREYLPTMVEVLLRCHSGLTDNELAIVDLIRDLSGRADPNPTIRI